MQTLRFLPWIRRSSNITKPNKEIIEQVRPTSEESIITRKDRPRLEEEGLEYEYKDELDALRRKERLTVDSTNTQYMTIVFNGEFDRDILTYPELLTKSESTQMNTLCERLKKFTDSIDRNKIERDNHIDKDIYKEMCKLKLHGLIIPEEFNGLSLNSQLSVRMFEELAVSPTITTQLLAHTEYGVRSLLVYGTDEQQRYYLPEMATGNMIATACITEAHSGSDIRNIETTATVSNTDPNTYIINGKKMWVTNGLNANVFLVYCKTKERHTSDDYDDRFSFFLVHRDMPGVNISPPISTLGLRGLGLTHIEFKDVKVNVAHHSIGQLGEGLNILRNLHGYVRTTLSGMCVGVGKRLIQLASERAIQRESFSRRLMDQGLIQKRLFHMEIDTYTMESMTYLTSGILDSFSMPVISIESALTKIFATDRLYRLANDCLEIFGVEGIEIGHPVEQYLRDIRPWSMFDVPNDVLRLLTAWEGVMSVSTVIHDFVRKIRNPIHFPGTKLRHLLTSWTTQAQAMRAPFTFKHDLWEKVHPSLGIPAKDLEYAIFVLRNVTKETLTKSGRDIIDNQLYLRRLSEIVMEIFAMTAMLGRSSRAYSIGLKNCEHETEMTFLYCKHARLRIDRFAKEVHEHGYRTGDEHLQHLAKRMLIAKGYPITTPLERTY
ncbi:unnamed protein product [Rotaria sordida]|uniref:Acyl-CoA dehydrogenase family member 9, mitochondrial n=1 Tax=Rotaria sordida TaxID=392033 RepID=A0A818P4S2_9BILA|nr:unnamed protein product [Rotaria sordida]CAF3554220.1 unnamed protein product [Rotaria sordida]CAF3615317.1 unnamed protein product [Rotaria sordida]